MRCGNEHGGWVDDMREGGLGGESSVDEAVQFYTVNMQEKGP
jgi:hypothetical protein